MKTFLDWAPEFKASVGVEPRLNHVIASIINQSKFSLIFNEKNKQKKTNKTKKQNKKKNSIQNSFFMLTMLAFLVV